MLTEYAALTVSALGCIAAVASAQVAYAAIPLTLSLGLNLLNRYRWEQKTRANIQSNKEALAQIERQLQNQIERLQAQVQMLPTSERITDVEASMLRLSTFWGQIQQRLEQQPSPAFDAKIRQEFAILRRAIIRLRDSSEANIATVCQNLEREISLLQEKLAQTSEVAERAAQRALADGSTAEIAYKRSQIAQMQKRVAKLELKNQQIVKPYLQRLAQDVKQQQSDTARIEESLEKLTNSIVDLMSQIDSLGKPSTPQLYSLSIQKLSENLPTRATSSKLSNRLQP
ncbi:MAG TPA: hypothetical protein IGR89_10330 [Oscillatoriaceae cyanobacterium M7585_C2015_266]|nr:hypothetical protein [Oscillatoriaceae cyanobacterium M7585_C2015_266]